MKRVLFAIGLAIFVAWVASAVPQPPHEIYGTVTSAGDPATDITVEATVDDTVVASDQTDNDGYYAVKILENATSSNFTIQVDDSTEKTYTYRSGATDELNATVASESSTDEDASSGGSSGESSSDDSGPVVTEPSPEPRRTTFEQQGNQQTATVSDVTADTPVTVSSNDSESPVQQITFTGSQDSEEITITVEDLGDSQPRQTPSPDTDVYKYKNITLTGVSDQSITEANITFTVSKTFITNAERSPEDITLKRYVGNEWQDLPTRISGEQEQRYEFTATTTGFSYYAVGFTSETEQVRSEPNISVTGFDIHPTTGTTPFNTTINVTTTNTGGDAGVHTVRVFMDGEEIIVEAIAVNASSSHTTSYEQRITRPGNLTFQTGDYVEVVHAEAPDTSTFWLYTFNAVIVLLAAITVAYVWYRSVYRNAEKNSPAEELERVKEDIQEIEDTLDEAEDELHDED